MSDKDFVVVAAAIAFGSLLGHDLIMGAMTWGQPHTTISIWQDTVEKSPHKVRPRLNLATAYAQAGEHQEAVDTFLSIVRDFPEDREAVDSAMMNIATIGMHYGMLDESQDMLEKVLSNRSELSQYGMSALAWIYVKRGRPLDALALLRTILALDSSFAKTSASLNLTAGMAFSALHDCMNAKKAFDNVKKLDASVPIPACF